MAYTPVYTAVYEGVYRAMYGTGGEDLTFDAPLLFDLNEYATDQTATYTRASTAMVADHEGILRVVGHDCARFGGVHIVTNYNDRLISSSSWALQGSATKVVKGDDHIVLENLSGSADRLIRGVVPTSVSTYGKVWVVSFYAKIPSGYSVTEGVNDKFEVYMTRMAGTSYQKIYTFSLAGVNTWTRFCTQVGGDFNPTDDQYGCAVHIRGAASDSTAELEIRDLMIEDISGQSVDAPNEYVRSQDLATAIWATQAFSTTNGNSRSGGVVTEAAGTPIAASTFKGVLLEGAATNLCLWNCDFTNAVWANWTNGLTVTANDTTAPDGSTTATKLASISAQSDGEFQAITLTSDAEHVVSAFFKYDTAPYSELLVYDNDAPGNLAYVRFQWSAGVPSTLASLGASDITYEDVGNDWYRVSYLFTTAVGNVNHRVIIIPDRLNPSSPYVAESTHVWGVQLEENSYASSYIPTTGSTETRNADALSYPDDSVLEDAEGSAYAELEPLGLIGNSAVFCLRSAPASVLYCGAGFLVQMSDGTLFPSTSGTLTGGTMSKIASRWETGGTMSLAHNGVLTLTPVSYDGAFGRGPGKIYLLQDSAGTDHMPGYIKNVRVYDRDLGEVKLEQMTT